MSIFGVFLNFSHEYTPPGRQNEKFAFSIPSRAREKQQLNPLFCWLMKLALGKGSYHQR